MNDISSNVRTMTKLLAGFGAAAAMLVLAISIVSWMFFEKEDSGQWWWAQLSPITTTSLGVVAGILFAWAIAIWLFVASGNRLAQQQGRRLKHAKALGEIGELPCEEDALLTPQQFAHQRRLMWRRACWLVASSGCAVWLVTMVVVNTILIGNWQVVHWPLWLREVVGTIGLLAMLISTALTTIILLERLFGYSLGPRGLHRRERQ